MIEVCLEDALSTLFSLHDSITEAIPIMPRIGAAKKMGPRERMTFFALRSKTASLIQTGEYARLTVSQRLLSQGSSNPGSIFPIVSREQQ